MVKFVEALVFLGYTPEKADAMRRKAIRDADGNYNKAFSLFEDRYTKILLRSDGNSSKRKIRKPRKPRKPRKSRNK